MYSGVEASARASCHAIHTRYHTPTALNCSTSMHDLRQELNLASELVRLLTDLRQPIGWLG